MRRPSVLLPCTPLAAARLALAPVALLAACATPVEMRQTVIATDAAWKRGVMDEGSFDLMLSAVQGLGRQPSDDEARLAAVPELLRVVLGDPSSLVRAEALRSAWRLARDLPSEPWRVDVLEREEFNRRTQRLEELVTEQGAATDPEALELARWLGQFHAPIEQPSLAVTVSEVVTCQALWRKDELGQVFREQLPSSLRHALTLATLHASGDPNYPVVREEALASARYLDPDTALRLVAGILGRETDSQVVLAALDSLEVQAPRVPAGDLRSVLEPLANSTDVAVRQRIRNILALAS